MNKIRLILILYNFLSIQEIIKDGVYNLIYNNLNIVYKKKKIIISNSSKYNSFFRINKFFNYRRKASYKIQQLETELTLTYSNKTSLAEFSKQNNKSKTFWNFIKTINNKYIIVNKQFCFLIIRNDNVGCEFIKIEEASKFDLIKIYEEVKENEKDNMLIEKEPIDVLIKYIDLRDSSLKRDNIHQIRKDYDNEELRYSIRSIIKNIPWIRQIFILMPNKNVRYFKEYSKIKKKIIYIKDKDFLGYDSSNSLAFQFRYWKMEKFGISENFIIMDDDCFIGKYLNKKDFFYVKNGKVVPAIITSKFIKLEKNEIEINYEKFKIKAKESKEEQNNEIFDYSLYLTYLFTINLFNKSLIIPKFTHNAIPVNLKELKEIFTISYNSKYKSTTLNSKYRHIESLQFQTLYLSYTFIKYNKKVRNIPYKLIKINTSFVENFNYSLFCLNTGAGNYSSLIFDKAKIIMEKLFPIPTPYEKIDYSFPSLVFNVVKLMENITINYEIKLKNIITINNVLNFKITLFIFIIIIFIKIIKKTKE